MKSLGRSPRTFERQRTALQLQCYYGTDNFSYLPLAEILRFHSLHPVLLSVLRSNYTPLPHVIARLLASGPPYPALLAKLPSLSLYLPPDSGPIFVELLTRARPRWIIERLELGRWPEAVWKEAYERRFLPSWRRFKGQDDTWRAAFLRMLGRLEHRNLGCTHEESWTVRKNRYGLAGVVELSLAAIRHAPSEWLGQHQSHLLEAVRPL